MIYTLIYIKYLFITLTLILILTNILASHVNILAQHQHQITELCNHNRVEEMQQNDSTLTSASCDTINQLWWFLFGNSIKMQSKLAIQL